ncbi:acyltransferase [Owenweeksia hongkongensis]|uniref:acyltransferase n=1 Tax=Owenweeksia hongkongensis TaxID=253245 RepID=UPI003A94FCB9
MAKIRGLIRFFFVRLKFFFTVNWVKTIYINIKTQTFSNAIKFPIIVYGRIKIFALKGDIIIKEPIKFGMVQLGKDMDHMPISSSPVKLRIEGDLEVFGQLIINSGAVIEVLNGSVLRLGKYCIICSGVFLKSENLIEIGKNTRITSGCFVMDTNMHSVRDVNTGSVRKRYEPILIGSHCWVAMNSTILKGTKLPTGTVVGRNSFLNRDYTQVCEEYSMIVGNPAIVRAKNIQRVWSLKDEEKIRDYFNNNLDEEQCFMGKGVIDYSDEELEYDFKIFY